MEIELWYFTSQNCGICKVLKPKIKALIKSNFPSVKLRYIDIEEEMEKAGQNSVFTIPVVLIIVDGKEHAH